MPEHREPSPSPSDRDPLGAGPAAADRFWEGFGRTRSQRARRNGENGDAAEHAHEAPHAHECLDWCPICRGADVVRAGAPPELREQWQALQRDALLAVRALIDAHLARTPQRPRPPGGSVEDIPID